MMRSNTNSGWRWPRSHVSSFHFWSPHFGCCKNQKRDYQERWYQHSQLPAVSRNKPDPAYVVMKSVPMPITIWFSQWWRKTVWCICILSALWRDVLSSNRKGDHPQSKRTDCQWKTRWIHLPVQHEPSPSAFTLWEGEHRPLIWMIWSAFESTRSSMPTTELLQHLQGELPPGYRCYRHTALWSRS